MKLNITLLFLFVCLGVTAQKQLQPYNYSVTKDEKTETILIYASAEAVNSITFTLKNEKNETLTTIGENKEDKEITFKVFPFIETSFRKHLVDAIISIKEKDEDNKEYENFNKTLLPLKEKTSDEKGQQSKDRKNAVQDVRNIYQFFNALTITAFQYDNEPVAGILKYKQSAIATKKTINGLNTEDYFNKQAKFIRKLLLEADNSENTFKTKGLIITKGKYKDFIADDFMKFLAQKNDTIYNKNNAFYTSWHKDKLKFDNTYNEIKRELRGDTVYFNNNILRNITKLNISLGNLKGKDSQKTSLKENKINLNINVELNIHKNNINDNIVIYNTSYLMQLFEYHQNLKKGKNRNSKSKLKLQIEKHLKKWYNTYELLKFMKGDLANNYFKEKYRKNLCEDIVLEYSKLIDTLNKKVKTEKDSIKKDEKKIDSLHTVISLLKIKLKEGRVTQDYLKSRTREDTITKKKLDDKKVTLKDLNNKIKSCNKEVSKYNNEAKKYQNEINFLIAKHKHQIVDVPWWRFDINNIEIDFNDGFIEHITVTGNTIHPEIDKIAILNSIKKRHEKYYIDISLNNALKGFYKEPYVKAILKNTIDNEFKFDNEFPIGFSSKTDFADLSNYNLYAFKGKEKVFSLSLTSVINLYIQKHQNDRLNFSPRDQVVTLPLDDPNKEGQIELKKEKSSKILNAKIFTDFNGLQESKPNGLVQIEVEKEIPIWTKRMHLGIGRSSNFGFVNYTKLNLTWAKLNNEDREVQVRYDERFVNNTSQIDKYITYLDLIRYENVSVGIDLNVASLDFPLIKTRIELNAGAHYGRLKVVDTLTNADGSPRTSLLDKDVNMIRIYPDVILRIRPDERFGGYLRFRPFRTIVPNNEEFFTVSSEDDFKETRDLTKSWLHRYELGAFYTPSAESDNKFFFRYRYTNTSQWETNGYSEIQLGYLIYLKF